MLNILIPMTGPNRFDSEEYFYPKPLIDIDGSTIFERSLVSYKALASSKRIIPIISTKDIYDFNIDYVIRQLVEKDELELVEIDKPTQGALCTSLLAIDLINNDDPLIVTSGDHIIDHDLTQVISHFKKQELDFGVITFRAVHPKWSFVRVDDAGEIVEAAEKRPISKHAIAGFYYFKKGADFVEAAKRSILKGATHLDRYFVSATLNEMILMSKRGGKYDIPASNYTNFYDANCVTNYAKSLQNRDGQSKRRLTSLSREYVRLFNARDLSGLEEMFTEDFVLEDPVIRRIDGRANVLEFLRDLFHKTKHLAFSGTDVAVSDNKSFIQFELNIDGKHIQGVDIISWKNEKMTHLRAHMEES